MVLLHDVGAPAGDSTRDEDRRVLRDGNPHHEIRHPAGKIDVGIDVLLLEHDLLHAVPDVEPLLRIRSVLLGNLQTPRAQDSRAVIAVLIHTVPKAH